MKYTTEIEIRLPRQKVVARFDNLENLYKWQKALKSFENMSGVPGQAGARSKLVYNMNGRTMEMTETIVKRNLPDEFHGIYEAKGVWNSFENYFSEKDEKTTNWKTVSEFRFSSFAMKAMAFLLPGLFKKQTLKTMNDFKTFAESHAD